MRHLSPLPLRRAAWLLALALLPALRPQAQTAIGHWRDCLDYGAIYHVEPAADRVFAASNGGVLAYFPAADSLVRLNKTTGLSDVGVATIAYDPASRFLVVAYNNSNIDLMRDGRVYNLSDIKRSELGGDKSIYRVRFHRGLAYVATGFGVVVIDLERHEVKETCFIGAGGTYTPVRDLALTADSLYAATGEGLKAIALNEPHPTISDRWRHDARLDSVSLTRLDTLGGRLLLAGYTFDPELLTLYMRTADGFRAWRSGRFRSVHSGGGLLALSLEEAVVRYDTALQLRDSLALFDGSPLMAFDAVTAPGGTLWVGHQWSGLVHIGPDGSGSHLLQGPFTGDNTFRLLPFNRRMMLCPGGYNSFYGNSYLAANIFTTDGHRWYGLDNSNGLLSEGRDLVGVAVNPTDTNEMAAALWGPGVALIRDNRVQAYYNGDNTNGALTAYSEAGVRAAAVAYDDEGSLWTLVSHSATALACRTADGEWRGFDTRALADMPAMGLLVWDSVNRYLWFSGRNNAIYVHDGKSRMARVNPNNGSKLSTDAVTALVQDRSGNLWVGTNKGLKVIYDAYRAFANGGVGEVSPVSCSNITITNGEFYEYLMAYESITAIAVDGANRKWVGTSAGGLYLLSANGMEQLRHFTAENSPLFSNRIVSLAVQPRTGEVYVGTDQGLQVYRSTATYAETAPLEQVYAFPNPVRPGYDGPIAIKGFTRDALVHITDAAGHTVYSTQALGGQAIWNGRTANGEPVAAGVYYVFAADTEGGNRSVTKILVVR